MKVQCPYKTRKFTCQYGATCERLEREQKGEMNDCPVAVRHYAGCPWRDEVPVQWRANGRVLPLSKEGVGGEG